MTQTINFQVYSQLVAEATPKLIETEDEYDRFLAVAERLTFKQEQTPEESALYALVTISIETYEAQHYPVARSSPLEVLEHIIESLKLTRSNQSKINCIFKDKTYPLAVETATRQPKPKTRY